MVAFRKLGVVGAAAALLFAATACGVTHNVDVNESGFSPKVTKTTDQSDTVKWTNTGTTVHTATSNGNGAFFDTGDLAPAASSTAIQFQDAGLFHYMDRHAPTHHGEVYVPLQVSPTASKGDSVFVVWAGSPTPGTYTIPPGFHADVQVKPTGAVHWKNWKMDQTGTEVSGSYTVTRNGIYRFRARYVKDGVAETAWTPPAVCNVT